VSPATLTTAFLFTQIVLVFIVLLGIGALRNGEKSFSPYSDNPRLATRKLPWFVAVFFVITIACFMLSEDYVGLSRPAFGDVVFPALVRSDAFLIVFLFDIVGAGFLIWLTGGSRESPFSAVLFSLPALSIFLRETPARFGLYTYLVVVAFLFVSRSTAAGKSMQENPRYLLAFQLVTLGCLFLSSLVGYATRPI
jgi:hypothetical protein